MRVNALRVLTCAALVSCLCSCVTINIYFPEAQAQAAADKVIDDVMDLKNPSGPAAQAAPAHKKEAP